MKYFEFVSVNQFPEHPEMDYGYYSITEYDSGLELFFGRIDPETAKSKLEQLRNRLKDNPDASSEHEEGEHFITDVLCGTWES